MGGIPVVEGNHRKPNSRGHKSKLVTRSEAGFYLVEEYLKEADRGLGLARKLKGDRNPAGP